MVVAADTSYPAQLQRDDRRRGQLDGQRRMPSLAEVRRRQQELRKTGGQLSVGYQVVLLAELSEKLRQLEIAFRQSERATALELARCDELIAQAANDVRRTEKRLRAAEAPLTTEELLPRNSEEDRWDEQALRNRREVARVRRIGWARESVEQAHALLEQRHAERAAAVRRHQEMAAEPGIRAQQLVELYQRRIAEYVSALAQHHPEGRTLYPLLSIPEIRLPDWVTEAPDDPPDTRSQT